MGVSVGISARNHTHGVIVRHGAHEVIIGGGHPVVVQSMTNTDTVDVIGQKGFVAEVFLHQHGRQRGQAPRVGARLDHGGILP